MCGGVGTFVVLQGSVCLCGGVGTFVVLQGSGVCVCVEEWVPL